jgi:hypothetical protein
MSVEQNAESGPAAGRLTAGIDWASTDHVVAVVDGAGVARTGSSSRIGQRISVDW